MTFFTQGICETSKPERIAKKFLQRLFMASDKDALDRQEIWRLFRAIIVKRDPVLMAAFRKGLRQVLKNLGESNSEALPAETKKDIIAYILCLLPHTELKPSEPMYEIPTWNSSKSAWELLTYKVNPIELTSTWGPEAFVMLDHERVFAYGLEPQDKARTDIDSILLFKGIPVPTGQGFATQWFAEGFSTPGSWLLYTGYASLQTWLKDKSVSVYGAGQGGSKACSLIDNPAVKRIYAYNPSNLGVLTRTELPSTWSKLESKPEVSIVFQHNERVYSYLKNIFPEWHIFRLSASQRTNPWMGSMLCHAAHASAQKTEVNAEPLTPEIHRQWAFYLMGHQILRHLAFGLFALPCRFVVLPFVRALIRHQTEALVISLFVLAGMMFPSIFAAPLGIAAVVWASLYLAGKLSDPLQRLLNFAPAPEADCHQVELEVNQPVV